MRVPLRRPHLLQALLRRVHSAVDAAESYLGRPLPSCAPNVNGISLNVVVVMLTLASGSVELRTIGRNMNTGAPSEVTTWEMGALCSPF